MGVTKRKKILIRKMPGGQYRANIPLMGWYGWGRTMKLARENFLRVLKNEGITLKGWYRR